VKPSGFLLGFPLFLAVCAYRLSVGGAYKKPENGRVLMSAFLTFVMSSMSIIYALNPTFWPSGPSDIWRLVGFPQMLLTWDRQLAFQAAVFGGGGWSGNRFIALHRSIFVEYSNAGLDLLFFVGLLWCVRRCVLSTRRGIADVSFVPVAYFLCNYALLICFLRLNWDRFYLPVELSMRIIAAIGIAGLAAISLQWAAAVRSAGAASTEVSR
jgi:hypothetical protein